MRVPPTWPFPKPFGALVGKMEFLALQCASCDCFCVQQLTKSRKWACRLCGAKQSIVKVFAKSFKAADVRGIVQQLSMARGTLAIAALSEDRMLAAEPSPSLTDLAGTTSSCWDEFVEPELPTTSAGCKTADDPKYVTAIVRESKESNRGRDGTDKAANRSSAAATSGGGERQFGGGSDSSSRASYCNGSRSRASFCGGSSVADDVPNSSVAKRARATTTAPEMTERHDTAHASSSNGISQRAGQVEMPVHGYGRTGGIQRGVHPHPYQTHAAGNAATRFHGGARGAITDGYAAPTFALRRESDFHAEGISVVHTMHARTGVPTNSTAVPGGMSVISAAADDSSALFVTALEECTSNSSISRVVPQPPAVASIWDEYL